MKASFFEPIRYVTSQELPAQWPLAPGFYDPEVGGQLFQSIIERLSLVEELGFDWVSFSEHHYGGRILTPSPIVMASHMAAHLRKVKIAVLGPIMALNNPVRVAEEFAMLDNLTQGRLVVGMLRGTTNEYLVYDVKPEEARDITTEGMELVLKAWTEPQPFGWQGRHFQFRSVSVWPRPWQQPFPPTFALGTSRESCDFAARHHLGLGVSFGPVDAMSRVTQYYREQCALYDWQPTSDQIIYRGHILLAETDAEAQEALQRRQELGEVTFPMRPGVRDALGQLDSRNIAGVPRPVFRDGPLPTTFVGSPETVVKQIQQFHDEAGVGVVDLSFQGTSAETPQEVLRAIQLFGKEVLPRLHEIDG
jgi:alkanesulfonate monooxygenase SsuD/methylene tetrahydromethanopterin reductase-like flavin-dependent oxidoreductase (luciferase family)